MKRPNHKGVDSSAEMDEKHRSKAAISAFPDGQSDVDDNTSDEKSQKEEKSAKLKKHPGAPKRFRT